MENSNQTPFSFFFESGPQDDFKLENSCEEEMEWEDASTDARFYVWSNYPRLRWRDFFEGRDQIADTPYPEDDGYIPPPVEREFVDGELVAFTVQDEDKKPEEFSEGWPELEEAEEDVPWGDYDAETHQEEEPPKESEKRYPVKVVGNTFFLPPEIYDKEEDHGNFDEEDITLPMTFVQYRRVISEYTEKSVFFKSWFKQQEDMRTREEFMDIWNEHCDDVYFTASAGGRMSFPQKASARFWHNKLFYYRMHRDQLKAHFENRVIRAEAEVREDEAHKEISTTFSNQRTTIEDSAFVRGQRILRQSGFTMPENEYHMRDVMNKPRLVLTTTWKTSDEMGAVLSNKLLPGGLLRGYHLNAVKMFNFARTAMKITVEINSTKFNQGILTAAFIPSTHPDIDVNHVLSAGQLLGCPHGRIDASACNSVSLEIPHVHPYSYFKTRGRDQNQYLGQFVLSVLSRLRSMTGSSTAVDVSVWVSFPACELHQLAPHQGATLLFAEAGVSSKPTSTNELLRWVPNTVTSMNFGDGVSRTNRLSLHQGTRTRMTPRITQSTSNDMDFHVLKKIPSRLTHFTVNTQQSSGDFIGQFPNYPCLVPKKKENDTPTPPVDVFEMTNLAYLVRPFKFYKGSLRYTFIAAANQMTSLKLQISYITGDHVLDASDAAEYSTVYWDIQEKHEISIVVPFMNHRGYNRCDKLVALADYLEERPNLSVSQVAIHVVNRLTVPDSSPQEVTIHVLVSAGDDFEVCHLSDLSFYEGTGDVIAEAGEESTSSATSDLVTTREDRTEAMMPTFGGHYIDPIESHTTSENTSDLRTVCRRFQKTFETRLVVDECTVVSFVNSPTLSTVNKPFNGKNGIQFRTHTAHFAECFTVWEGSLRYVLSVMVTEGSDVHVKIFHVPGIFHTEMKGSTCEIDIRQALGACEVSGQMIGTTKVQSSWEFEIPMYTPYEQLFTTIEKPNANWSARCATGTVYVVMYANRGTKCIVELYQAISDDFSFHLFRGVPQVQFKKLAEGARNDDDDAGWLFDESFLPYPTPKAEALVDMLPRNPYSAAIDAMESVTRTARTTEELIADIHNRVAPREIRPEENEALTFLDKILANLPGMVGTATGIFGNIAALTSGFQAYLTAESTFVKACAIVTILREIFGTILEWTTQKLTQMALSVISAMVGGSKQGNQGPRCEADIIEFIPVIIGVATSALVVFGFQSIPDDKDTKELCSNISNKLRLFNFGSTAISNVKGLYKEMKEFTEWVLEQIMSLAAPEYLAQLQLHKGFDRIEAWAQFIEITEPTDYVSKANFDREFRNEVLRCVDQANQYNDQLLKGNIGREATIVRGYVQRALSMGEKVKNGYKNLPVRIDPMCVCVYGTTAMGKSSMATELGYGVMDRLGYPKEGRWCAHNPTDQYFTENYRGQDALYIDDISLFTDVEQYKNFANLKSNTALPLNLAFNKGQMFTSDFIWTTTNVRYPTLNECNQNSALQRRRNILIESRWRSREIMNRVLNGENELRENHQHLQFRIIPSIDPQLAAQLGIRQAPPTRWMEYGELMEDIIRRCHVYFRDQERIMVRNLNMMGIEVPEEIRERQIARENMRQADENFQDALQHLERRLENEVPQQGVGPDQAFIEREIAEAIDDEMVGPEGNQLPAVVVLPPIPERDVRPNLLLAQAGEEIDIGKAQQCRFLSTFSPEFLQTLYHDKGGRIVNSSVVKMEAAGGEDDDDPDQAELMAFEKMREEHRSMLRSECTGTEEEINAKLAEKPYGCVELEFLSCIVQTRLQKKIGWVSKKLAAVKSLCLKVWTAAKSKLPLLAVFETLPGKIVAVAVAILGFTGLSMKMAHKCYCHSVRNMGYRCRICGRWPVLDHCLNRPWILQEWQTIYGEEPYVPNRITSLEEEAQFAAFEDGEERQKILIGTKEHCAAQMGPYSDVTKGLSVKQVVPHVGPYSDVTKGAAARKIVAHARVDEIVNNRLSTAIFRVRCTFNLKSISMNAVAIGGKKFLIVKHFMDVAKMCGSFEILHSQKWVPVVYEEERYKQFPNKDLVIVEIPCVQNIRSLVNHFIEESVLQKFSRTNGAIIRVDKSGMITCTETEAKAIDEQVYSLEFDGKLSSYCTRGMWQYKAVMGPGTCGSILITTENKSNGIILGLHAAGDGRGVGYATLITKEMVQDAIESGKLGTPIPKAEFCVSKVIPDGHFGLVGKVEQGMFQSDRTTIIPTAIQGMITAPATAPAALSSKDPRIKGDVNLLAKCIGKYGGVAKPFNVEDRKLISEDVRESFGRWKLARSPKVLSTEEAIHGIEGLEGYDRLPMNTSPGYPWVLSRKPGTSGKAYLFDAEATRIEDESVRLKFEAREAMARLGERVESIWACCLKDERRSHQKIADGNTRMFVIPPVDYSILERKYMLDYSVALKDNRHISSSKVGIDPQSLEWTELYNYIAGFSSFVFTGDFKNFDGIIPPDLSWDFYSDADYFYQKFGEWEEGDRKVRLTLNDEGLHTVCIVNNLVFVTHIGNKSGNPNTVNKNGDVNDRLMKLAFLELARRNGKLPTMSEFHRNVRVAVYGDDNIVAVKPEVMDWYNQVTVSAFLAEYGITYTDALKSGEMKPFVDLEEMTFLKQSFRDHEGIKGIKVPHMAEQTITELLNWTRIAPDQDELLESNCNDALRFAYFKGQTYFNSLRGKILVALAAKSKKHLRIMTYSDFHFWFLYVCGMLPCKIKTEGLFEEVAKSGNSPSSREISRLVSALPYAVLSKTGLLKREDKTKKTDDRYAIAIPSGEGKSWLCEHFPGMFVDHDEILLPEAEKRLKEKGLNWEYLWGMFDVEYPKDDRRILLVHHPGNTRRRILGCYKLPKPNYIRANAYQRLRLKNAKVLERDERNAEILQKVQELEHSLWLANGSPSSLLARK
ncbi:MAG: polyprotein [Guiyang Dicistro-like virus 4]|nr:MAG: polyprotein [Guiyang Dicistro-like virus 4]